MTLFDPANLAPTLAIAESLARQAGALLKAAAGQPRQITYKGVIDMVTQYDKQCETLIVSGLRDAFPDHAIIGEEGTGQGIDQPGSYTWYVDPLDGTTNFAHGYPHFCTSIGLADPDGKSLLGAVYDPTRDECFTAFRGGGAFLNGQRLRVSGINDVSQALVLSEFGYDKWTNPENNTEEWTQMVLRAQATLTDGAAALNLCYVAAGRADACWIVACQPWDIMAGFVMIEEAGGRISNFRGTADGVYQGKWLVVSNGHIHERMLTILLMGPSAPLPGNSP